MLVSFSPLSGQNAVLVVFSWVLTIVGFPFAGIHTIRRLETLWRVSPVRWLVSTCLDSVFSLFFVPFPFFVDWGFSGIWWGGSSVQWDLQPFSCLPVFLPYFVFILPWDERRSSLICVHATPSLSPCPPSFPPSNPVSDSVKDRGFLVCNGNAGVSISSDASTFSPVPCEA